MWRRVACESLRATALPHAPIARLALHDDPQLEELEELEAEASARGNDASATAKGEEDPAAIAAAKEKAIRKRCRVLPLELQRLFTRLQLLDRRSIGTNELTERGFKWTGSQGSVQHDVAELNRKLYERIEKSLARLPGDRLVGDLYKGVTGNAMTCMRCSAPRERTQDAYDVIVTVREATGQHPSLCMVEGSDRAVLRRGRPQATFAPRVLASQRRFPCRWDTPQCALRHPPPPAHSTSPLRRSRALRTWSAP